MLLYLIGLAFTVTIVLGNTTENPLPVTDKSTLVRCPRGLLCEEHCFMGRVTDENGCETCKCRTSSEEVTDKPAITDTPPCSRVMCFMACNFGFELDDNGCEVCRCKPNPCQSMECEVNEVCKTEMPNKCETAPCYPIGVCKPKSLCNYHSELHDEMQALMMSGEPMMGGGQGMGSMMMDGQDMGPMMMGPMMQRGDIMDITHKPECEESTGLFSPRQCHAENEECWCVNDWGEEIHDSRHTMDKDMPCRHNLTQSAQVSFMVVHDFDMIDPNDVLDDLSRIMQDQLMNWMMIGQQYMNDFELNWKNGDQKNFEVQFVLQRNDSPKDIEDSQFVDIVDPSTEGAVSEVPTETFLNPERDIASALYQLGAEVQKPDCGMEYRGFSLRPDPKSFTVLHSYEHEIPSNDEPMLPSNGGLKEEPTLYLKGRNFCHRHPRVAVASLAAGTILIVSLICLLAMTLKKKKSTNKSETYKNNLAFANKCYYLDKPAGDFYPEKSDKEEICFMTDEKPSIA